MTRRATVFARAEVTRIVIEALAAGQELADRGLTECAGETRCEMRLGAGQEAGVKARLAESAVSSATDSTARGAVSGVHACVSTKRTGEKKAPKGAFSGLLPTAAECITHTERSFTDRHPALRPSTARPRDDRPAHAIPCPA